MSVLEKRGRDRLQIMAEVLRVTMYSTPKTEIMYKASLSFTQLNEYLSLLLGLGLLKTRKKGQKTVYRTTRKGVKYLRSYDVLHNLLRRGYIKYERENQLGKIKLELGLLKESIDRIEKTLMPSMECPECQETIFSDFPFCPYCGKKLQNLIGKSD